SPHVALFVADACLDAGVSLLELLDCFADGRGVYGDFSFVAGEIAKRRGDSNQVSHGSVLVVVGPVRREEYAFQNNLQRGVSQGFGNGKNRDPAAPDPGQYVFRRSS